MVEVSDDDIIACCSHLLSQALRAVPMMDAIR